MYNIFLYLRVIFDHFIPLNNMANINRLQAIGNDYIWDPEDYKNVPNVENAKPDDMSQENYNALRKPNEDAVREILNVKLVDLFKKKLNEALNSDGEDHNITSLDISTEITKFYFGTWTDYNTKVNTQFNLVFKLNWTTFTIHTGDIFWYNP